MADRRTKLMTGGGIALAGAVAVGAIAGSVGIFGLADDPPWVGKLSPIDAPYRPPAPTRGSDGAPPSTAASPAPTTTATTPSGDDHGGRRDHDDSSGPGSSSSGRDHDDD